MQLMMMKIPASSLKVLDQVFLGVADVDPNAPSPPCCLEQNRIPHLYKDADINTQQYTDICAAHLLPACAVLHVHSITL